MNAADVVAYQYRADLFCERCILRQCSSVPEIEHALNQGVDLDENERPYVDEVLSVIATFRDIDRDDERSFDSDEFPKVVFRDQARHGVAATDDREGYDPTDRCGQCSCVLADADAIDVYADYAAVVRP